MVYEITTIVLLSIFATIMPSLSKELDVSGNFKVAGLFKLHSSSENGECDILNVDEFLKMERMLYEIDLLNQRQNPPGITLGAKIVDTCGKDVSDVITNLFQPTVCEQPRCDNLLGIITAPSTETHQILSHFPFAIPVVEFSESCPVVGSSDEWPVYCISSVPGRPTQFEAMLELVQSYDWNYLSVVYQDNEYGWKSLNALEKEARDRGVCIATSLKVPVLENDDVLVDDMYDEIVERLRYQSNAATGVIVILDEPSTVLLMGTAQRKGLQGRFLWIVDEKLVSSNIPRLAVAEGAIAFVPRDVSENTIFKEYINRLSTRSNYRDPWFVEYLEQRFDCRFGMESTEDRDSDDRPICQEMTEVPIEGEAQVDDTTGISQAVHAFGHALQNLESDFDRADMRSQLDHIFSQGNEDMSSTITYDILNLQKSNLKPTSPSMVWLTVGGYRNKQVQLYENLIKFTEDHPELPVSVCSLPCEDSYDKVLPYEGSCCWVCVSTKEIAV